MGRKQQSTRARKGKRSLGSQGFKGLTPQEKAVAVAAVDNNDSVNNVNTSVNNSVNSDNSVNTSNTSTEPQISVPITVSRPVPVLPQSTKSGPNQNPNSRPSTLPSTPAHSSPLKKSIAARIASRKFRKLTNKSADKIKRNSRLSLKKPIKCARRTFKRKCSLKPKTVYKSASGFKLLDSSILNNVLATAVCCVKCRKKAICFEEYCGKNNGFNEFLRLTCKNCGYSQNFQSSKRIKGFSESNVRPVLASQSTGRAGQIPKIPNALKKQQSKSPVKLVFCAKT